MVVLESGMWKTALYDWMKTLAVYYLLFSVFLHLVPDSSYERYIRFFMGIFLIVLLAAPILSLVGGGTEFLESFSVFYEKENIRMEEEAIRNWEKMEAEIRDELERKYGTAAGKSLEEASEDETEAVGDSVSDRTSAYSSLTSGF